MKRINYMNIYF